MSKNKILCQFKNTHSNVNSSEPLASHSHFAGEVFASVLITVVCWKWQFHKTTKFAVINRSFLILNNWELLISLILIGVQLIDLQKV